LRRLGPKNLRASGTLAVMTKARLRKLIRKHGLAAREPEILKLADEGLRLLTRPAARLRAGASKFGGLPDLPRGTPWPTCGKRPLMFLAQINIKDVAAAHSEFYWPIRDGLLSFFYDVAEQPWGDSPKDRDGWRIFYTPARTALKALPLPKGVGKGTYETAPVPQRAISFQKVLTIPPHDNLLVNQVIVREAEQKRYFDLWYEYVNPLDESHHQWGGWPTTIQNDLELNCQLTWHGVEDPFGMEKWNGRGEPKMDPRTPYLTLGASRWKLLLQIASDDDLGLIFGDEGNIYFCATAETIALSEFKEVWVELQCA
jgi:uncharacterized protein YwqG